MSSFCLACGLSLQEGQAFCGNCGRDSSLGEGSRPDPAAPFSFPPETSPKAIFSLVCGFLFFFPPAAIVGVVLGHLSLSDVRKSSGKQVGRGLAITGLVLGYLGVGLGVMWIVLVGIYMPKSTEAARKAPRGVVTTSMRNPTVVRGFPTTHSAVSMIRSLNMAEIAYAHAHPATGYTCSLPDLRKAWGVNEKLVNGYVFALQGCKAIKPNGPIAKYDLVATPQTEGKKQPTYCSSESDEIRVAVPGAEKDCWKSGASLSATRVNNE